MQPFLDWGTAPLEPSSNTHRPQRRWGCWWSADTATVSRYSCGASGDGWFETDWWKCRCKLRRTHESSHNQKRISLESLLNMLILDLWQLLPVGVKGYPPHDAGVNEGEAEIGHQGDRPIETLEKQDGSRTLQPRRNTSLEASREQRAWSHTR